MADRTDSTTANRSRVNGFAQVMERIGLALVGALCGLFVCRARGKANIEDINSIGSAAVGGAVRLDRFLYGNQHSFVAARRALSLSLRQRFASVDESDRV